MSVMFKNSTVKYLQDKSKN